MILARFIDFIVAGVSEIRTPKAKKKADKKKEAKKN